MILDQLFKLMSEKSASDIYISAGTPIHIKINGASVPINKLNMDPATIKRMAYEVMSEEQQRIFEQTLEMNLSVGRRDIGNFRVNIFKQRNRGANGIPIHRAAMDRDHAIRIKPDAREPEFKCLNLGRGGHIPPKRGEHQCRVKGFNMVDQNNQRASFWHAPQPNNVDALDKQLEKHTQNEVVWLAQWLAGVHFPAPRKCGFWGFDIRHAQ